MHSKLVKPMVWSRNEEAIMQGQGMVWSWFTQRVVHFNSQPTGRNFQQANIGLVSWLFIFYNGSQFGISHTYKITMGCSVGFWHRAASNLTEG